MLPDGRPTEDVQHGRVQNAIPLKLRSVIQTANLTSMQDNTAGVEFWRRCGRNMGNSLKLFMHTMDYI